jgi:hypothetical protein
VTVVLFPKPNRIGWIALVCAAFLVASFIIGAVEQDAAIVITSGATLCFLAGSLKAGSA